MGSHYKRDYQIPSGTPQEGRGESQRGREPSVGITPPVTSIPEATESVRIVQPFGDGWSGVLLGPRLARWMIPVPPPTTPAPSAGSASAVRCGRAIRPAVEGFLAPCVTLARAISGRRLGLAFPSTHKRGIPLSAVTGGCPESRGAAPCAFPRKSSASSRPDASHWGEVVTI